VVILTDFGIIIYYIFNIFNMVLIKKSLIINFHHVDVFAKKETLHCLKVLQNSKKIFSVKEKISCFFAKYEVV